MTTPVFGELALGKLQSDSVEEDQEQSIALETHEQPGQMQAPKQDDCMDEPMEEKQQEQKADDNGELHEKDAGKVENDDEKNEQEKGPQDAEEADDRQGRKAPRRNLRSRVLGEFGDASPEEALAKIAAKLLADDAAVAEAKAKEAEAASAVEAVLVEAKAASDEVKLAEQKESEILDRIKSIEMRRKLAARQTAKQRSLLQERQDILVLIEMESMSRSKVRENEESFETEQQTKKQRIEELEQVMAESRKQVEEFKQKERDAKEAMKLLLKEQQKSSRLGPFSRRVRASMTKSAAVVSEASDLAGASSETSVPAASVVHVKKELGALQAFARSRDVAALPVVITLDDSQE